MKKALAILIVIILALIAGFAGGVYYSSNHSDNYNAEQIEESIQNSSELATLRVDYTDEGKYTGDPKKVFGFNVPFTSKEMRINYSGIIKIGPDLQKRLDIDLNNDASKVNVTIPHSEILSHEIDESSMKFVYIKNGVFNSVTPENANELRKDTKAKKEKSIKDGDYFDQADKYAVEQLTNLLTTAYPDLNVEVKVK